MASRFLKALERVSRRVLFRLVSGVGDPSGDRPGTLPPRSPVERILILRQDRMGDMVMTLPVLRGLRSVHPGARICLVATPAGASVLRREEGIEVILLRKSPPAFLGALARARRFAPDVAVDMHMHDSTTSFLFAALSGARWSVHAEGSRRLPFDVRVPVRREGHIVEAFAALLSSLGEPVVPSDDRAPRIGAGEAEYASEFWRSAPVSPGECIGVNLSAGGENRWWGEENFVVLCRMLTAAGRVPFVIHGPDHAVRARSVLQACPGALAAPPVPDLLHLSALLDGLRMMVSPDTSVVHIAASRGIPVVGLYLPAARGLPRWHPWGVPSAVLTSGDSASLASIAPSMVFGQVERLLGLTEEALR